MPVARREGKLNLQLLWPQLPKKPQALALQMHFKNSAFPESEDEGEMEKLRNRGPRRWSKRGPSRWRRPPERMFSFGWVLRHVGLGQV